MEINLLNPNRDDLLKKWEHVLFKVRRIFSWTTDEELAWICEYVQNKKRYLEIGSYVGKSMKCALLANNNIEVAVSVDTWDDEESEEEYHFNLRKITDSLDHFYFKGDSREILSEQTIEKGFDPFDCCWIDGGHLEDIVEFDCNAVRHLMTSGALMAGHDYYGDNDVARGVHKSLGKPHNPIGSVWCYQL